MRGSAPSSTRSASNTSSCPRRSATRPAASTRRLLKVLERFDAVMNIMLPSLREERAQTYSPFLPIDPKSGVVLQVPVLAHDAKRGTITYEEPETQERFTVPVTGGRCKLQWKPDWAMRWVALGIDYEMAGKDLIDSVKLSRRDLPRARRHAAGGIQLRALPRREGPEDLQVEGQRPDHRRMAALRQPREPVAVHVPRAEVGEAALLRRHPAPCRRVPAVSSTATSGRTASSGSAIRSGTSIPASRPRPTCRFHSRCC